MTARNEYGLTGGGAAVPLRGVRVEGRLAGSLLSLVFEQTYRNEGSVPIEAVYRFPLPERAALTGFVARIGAREIEGVIEARDKAFERYDDAMAAGHGAYLLDQERPNVFTMSVGNVLPGEEVVLRLTTIELLEANGDAVELRLPTTIGPRYTPAGDTTEGVPLAEQVAAPYADSVPYGLTLSLLVEGDVASLSSPSHDIVPERSGNDWQIALLGGAAQMDRDLVVQVARPAGVRQVRRVTAGRESFYALEVAGPEAPARADLDVTFLVDISYSMNGPSLAGAKRAMEVALRALPAGSAFNICFYDTAHEMVFGEPRSYGVESLNEALAAVRAVQARGGTCLKPALAAVLAQQRNPGRRHAVLLLTDGDVGNEAEICALASGHRGASRVFCIGVGHGPNGYLIGELARSGGGASVMIGPNEAIEEKTLRIFGKMLAEPHVGIELKAGRLRFELARQVPVFCGETVTLVARARGVVDRVTLSPGGERIPVAESRADLPRLWARERIGVLEASATPDAKEVEKLSLAYGVASGRASFVGIEKRAGGRRCKGEATRVRVPLLVTAGHGTLRLPSATLGSLQGLAFSGPVYLSGACGLQVDRVANSMNSIMASFDARLSAGAPDGLSGWAQPVGAAAGSAGGWAQSGALRGLTRQATPGARTAPFAGPAVPPVPAEPAEPADRLFAVLSLQSPDGSFAESPRLLQLIGASADALSAAKRCHGRLAVTWLVLQWLAAAESGRSSLWMPLVAKSRALLAA